MPNSNNIHQAPWSFYDSTPDNLQWLLIPLSNRPDSNEIYGYWQSEKVLSNAIGKVKFGYE